jgi:hypothetical protein
MFSDLWQTAVQFPFAVNVTVYVILIVIAIAGLYFIWVRGRAAEFTMRWTTQDILILAIMGVLLEVYDNLIGNGAAAAIWAPVAIFIARSVNQGSTHEVADKEVRTDLAPSDVEIQKESGA